MIPIGLQGGWPWDADSLHCCWYSPVDVEDAWHVQGHLGVTMCCGQEPPALCAGSAAHTLEALPVTMCSHGNSQLCSIRSSMGIHDDPHMDFMMVPMAFQHDSHWVARWMAMGC